MDAPITTGPNAVNSVLPGGNGDLSSGNGVGSGALSNLSNVDTSGNITQGGGSNVADYTGTTPINSSSLSSSSPINYSTPNLTAVPSVSGLNDYSTPALTATPLEGQANDLSARIEGLNNDLVGKSAYQTQQDTAAGVDTLNQQQTDLSTQLSQLKNEALAIPQQLQLSSTGRGITAGGLAPLQTASLRTNAIAALGISSLLDATKGLLASAQAKADKAVAAKYDPIQEQIDAATKNLDIILKSPEYSLEEKNRAQKQLDIQNQKQAQLDTAKQNAKDVLSAAQTAAANGADASTLQKMQAAPDGVSALNIAVAAGYGNNDISSLLKTHPDAGILPTDNIQQANAKIIASPSYTLDQKAKILDNAIKTQSLLTAANDKSQQGMEQKYAQSLLKEVSSRSGGLGLQDAKVNQAIHLQALLDQNSTLDSQGNIHYNITPQNFNELAMGLASLISGSNSVTDSARADINAKTAAGDFAGALQYITGSPQKGSTDAIIQNLADSIARQGQVAQQERDTYVNFLHGLAPTDLDPARRAALEANTLNQFNPVSPKQAINAINTYTANNPNMLSRIIAAHSVPGVTDQEILDYIKNPANGFDNYGDLP